MFLRFVLVVMIVLSTACAHVGKSEVGDAVKQAVNVEEKIFDVKKVVVAPSKLDAALLYNLLGGELAGQRGDVNMASAFYGQAAKSSKDPQIALRAAQIALYNKDIVAAKSAIDILVADNNMSAQSHRLALTIYLRSSDVEKSLNQIELIVEKSNIPQRNTLLAIGDIVLRNSAKATAIEVMDGLANRYPIEAAVYLSRSQIMSHLAELDHAEEDAIKATKLDVSWPTGFVQLALVLENSGKSTEALAVLQEASERLKTRQLVMGYGQLLAKNEQYAAAKDQFLELVANEKDYPEGKFALGLVYLKLDDAEKAKAAFEGLYNDGKMTSKASFYLGRITYHQKKLKPALTWFKKVEKGSHYVESQTYVAMITSDMGDLQGARSVMQTLRNDFPKSSARFYLMEAELLMDGRHNQTLFDLLNEAIEESPSNLALRYARSIAATELDELVVAEEDLLFVLERQPKDVNALNALGYTLASKTFRFKEARHYLSQALSLRPNDSAILDSMGWLSYREGQYEQALVLLEKAYEKAPEGEIAAHLGETLWMLGRQKEARILWQEALKRDGDNRYLLEVLKRLK